MSHVAYKFEISSRVGVDHHSAIDRYVSNPQRASGIADIESGLGIFEQCTSSG